MLLTVKIKNKRNKKILKIMQDEMETEDISQHKRKTVIKIVADGNT